jgi:hypothetical protein
MSKTNAAAIIAPAPKHPPITGFPPPYIFKKIGNTKYRVAVHFSNTSRERMEDKIIRLAENDLNYTNITAIIKSPQAGRLLKGGSSL